MSVQDRSASAVRLLLFDVDGVLTDGAVMMHADGSESKGFHIRDGAAMVWAQRAGLTVGSAVGAIVGRDDAARRAARRSGSSCRAVAARRRPTSGSCRQAGLDDAAVAYMGDDLLDLPVLARVGLSAAPADARTRSARARGLGQRARAAAAARRGSSSRWCCARRTLGRRRAANTRAERDGTLRAPLSQCAARAARRPRRRQGLGALQAAGRPLDRSPPRARIAALHARPEFSGRQPDRSGDRGAEQGRRTAPAIRSRFT